MQVTGHGIIAFYYIPFGMKSWVVIVMVCMAHVVFSKLLTQSVLCHTHMLLKVCCLKHMPFLDLEWYLVISYFFGCKRCVVYFAQITSNLRWVLLTSIVSTPYDFTTLNSVFVLCLHFSKHLIVFCALPLQVP